MERSSGMPRKRARAQVKIAVQSSEAKPYDQTVSPELIEIRLSETFTGDMDGESPVRALQVLRDDHSACLVSLQRFYGKLANSERDPTEPWIIGSNDAATTGVYAAITRARVKGMSRIRAA